MLDETVRQLARAANYGTITTLLSDGSPATHVMWVDADDDHVVVNTEVHRAKYHNIRRDPRVSVVIWDRGDPYTYVEVRGRAVDTITGPEARAHIDALSEKYTGKPYGNRIVSERVIVKIAPDRQRA